MQSCRSFTFAAVCCSLFGCTWPVVTPKDRTADERLNLEAIHRLAAEVNNPAITELLIGDDGLPIRRSERGKIAAALDAAGKIGAERLFVELALTGAWSWLSDQEKAKIRGHGLLCTAKS